jgi:hypothetical protein
MIATTLLAAAAEPVNHGNVAAETVIFGIIALCVFSLLAFVTFSYHNVAHRRSSYREEATDASHGQIEHGAGHGH